MTVVYSSQRPRIVQTVTDNRYTFTLEVDEPSGTRVLAEREVDALDADWLLTAREEMAKHNAELIRADPIWNFRSRSQFRYPPSLEGERAFMRAVAVIFPDVDVPEAQHGWLTIAWKLGTANRIEARKRTTLYFAVAREMVDLHRDWSEDPVRFRFQENEDGSIELWLTSVADGRHRARVAELGRWTQHHSSCPRNRTTAERCTCGLQEAWEALDRDG